MSFFASELWGERPDVCSKILVRLRLLVSFGAAKLAKKEKLSNW